MPAHFKSILEKDSGLASYNFKLCSHFSFCANRGLVEGGDEQAGLHAPPSPFIAPSQSRCMPYHRLKIADGEGVVKSGDAALKYKENRAWLFVLLGE